jgi:hypothetical protein
MTTAFQAARESGEDGAGIAVIIMPPMCGEEDPSSPRILRSNPVSA